MSSKKPNKPWPADPHTLAKIAILKNYLESWFSIFGMTRRGQDVLYIDGFAGPGVYEGGEPGSPVVALVAAAKISGGSNWFAGKINCAFIEANRTMFSILTERISPFLSNNKLSIKSYSTTFIDGFSALKMDLPTFFSSEQPLFAFIDPFGVSGAPFSIVKEILSSPSSEVLVNFDSDGIARNYRAYTLAINTESKLKSEQLLNSVFDGDEWKNISPLNYQKIMPEMVELYKSKLLSLPKVKYVISFEMRGVHDQNNYYLIFASQHPLGLRKMKNAMKRIDQAGDYSFSDAGINQNRLFRFDEPTDWAVDLYDTFKGTKRSWDFIDDVTLISTPFENPKSMLSVLDKRGLIKVYPENPKRRKGTFADGTVREIEFVVQ